MQLKTLGSISGIIKNLGSGAKSIQAVTAATEGLSIAQTKALLSTTSLEAEEIKAILATKGLEGAQLQEASAAIINAQAHNKLSVGIGGASNAFKGLGAVIKANPILTIASTFLLVIAGINKLKQHIDETTEELRNKAVESANTLTESLSNLSDYTKKIEDLKNAISSDNISQSEATEKRKQLLAIQEELIEKYGKEQQAIDFITESIQGETSALNNLQDIAAQNYLNNNIKQIKEAKNYLTKTNEQNAPLPFTTVGVGQNPTVVKYENFAKIISEKIAPMAELLYTDAGKTTVNGVSFKGNYEDLISQYDEVLNNIREYIRNNPIDVTSSDEDKWTIDRLREFESYISKLRSRIDADEERQKYEKIYDTALKSVLLTSNTYSEYYNKLIEAKSKYTEALTSGNQEETTKTYTELQDLLNEIFSLDFIDEDNVSGESIKGWFENIRSQIYNLSKETPVIIDIQAELKDSSDNGYANKIKALSSSKGYTASDLKSIIAKGDLGEDLGDDKDLYDNIKGYVDLWNSVAQYTDRATITTDEYITALEKVGAIQKEVAEGSESSFALSKGQTKELKSVHSDVDKLNKAYQNLFAGKLTTNDVAELVDLFPTLGEYVDWTDEKFGNLADGIDKVIRERPADLIKQLEEIDTSGMSDEAKKAIDSMITALKQLKPELKDTKTLIEEIQKAIKGVSSSISTLIGFTKEISENGSLSLSSIDTIMTDDTYKSLRPYINDMEGMQTAITELVAKQKDAYEDLYNAEMYENDYEAYHKAVQEKEKDNENLLSDSIKKIEDEIKYFNDAYDIDVTNWDTLTDAKKNILQNTNAELLSKQAELINKYKESYGVDLTNYKNTAMAKAAIAEKLQDYFVRSETFARIRKYVNEHNLIGGMNNGVLSFKGNAQDWEPVQAMLVGTGLNLYDIMQYLQNGTVPEDKRKTLQEYLKENIEKEFNLDFSDIDKLIKPYTITSDDWEKINANIKSTGSSSSSSKNYIDWIERRLKKFAQTTKEVFAKVADYITFNSQNSQLRKAINAISDEIAVNERAYQAYMNEANKIGLASDWVTWIQNGDYSIQDISNLSDDLKDKISRYKELYDQAIDCKNAVDDLRKTEKEYANQMLSNVEKYYSNRINYVNSDVEYYNSLDTDNLFMNKNFDAIRKSYNEQISYTQKEHDDLLDTLNSLVSSGSIKYQSDEWYEWWAKIQKCNVEVRNLKKSIHDLASEQFNNIKNNFDNLLNHIEHQGSLLQESINQTEEKGYIVSTKYYNALISNENKNITQLTSKRNKLYDTLQQAIKSGDIQKSSNEWHQMVQEIESVDLAIEQANTSVIKFNNSIRDIQWQVFDLLQDRMSQISAESNFLINLMKNDDLYVKKGQGASQLTNQGLSTMGLHGVNYDVYMAQSNKYAQEILKIDKQLAKDPYNQTLINRRKELLKLQQDMIMSANDEKQAIVSMVKDGIELELNSLKELIDKYNESLDKQKDLYDYQKKVKEQTKEIAALEKQMIAFAGDNSEETKAKVQQLKVDLETARENLQETQYDKFVSDSKKLLDDFYNDYETILNQRLDNVDSLISDMINHINGNASTIQQTIVEASNSVGYSISDSMNTILDNKSRLMLWEDVNVSNNNVILAVNNLTNSINRMVTALDNNSTNTIGHYKKYKSGTHTVNYNQMAWTNENGNSEVIIRKSDGAILTPLAKDDMVLNGYATDNLFSIANDPSKFIRDNLFGANQYNGTSNINNVNSNYSVSVDNINLNLPNVKNYEDFFYAAQHDKRFEKMVQAMTVDKLFGGSSLKKYRV